MRRRRHERGRRALRRGINRGIRWSAWRRCTRCGSRADGASHVQLVTHRFSPSDEEYPSSFTGPVMHVHHLSLHRAPCIWSPCMNNLTRQWVGWLLLAPLALQSTQRKHPLGSCCCGHVSGLGLKSKLHDYGRIGIESPLALVAAAPMALAVASEAARSAGDGAAVWRSTCAGSRLPAVQKSPLAPPLSRASTRRAWQLKARSQE